MPGSQGVVYRCTAPIATEGLQTKEGNNEAIKWESDDEYCTASATPIITLKGVAFAEGLVRSSFSECFLGNAEGAYGKVEHFRKALYLSRDQIFPKTPPCSVGNW